jgi:hypothetical protein
MIDYALVAALRMDYGSPRLAFRCRRSIPGFYTFGNAVA